MLKESYILGLVDGEGSFTVFVRNAKALQERYRKRRVRIEPKFYLKIVESDKKILYELKNFLVVVMFIFRKILEEITRIVIVMKCQVETIW